MEINNMVLSRLLSDYIEGMKDKPRHTKKADIEAGKELKNTWNKFLHQKRIISKRK